MRLAVHLFGHVRTYKQTYQSFLKYVIEINRQDGWEIDIFLHTWNKFDEASPLGHYYPGLTNVALKNEDIKEILTLYNPADYLIEELPSGVIGLPLTIQKVNQIRQNYSKKMNITYDYYLYTRPDIMFYCNLKINEYLKLYKPIRNINNGWEGVFKDYKLPSRVNFVSSNAFRFGVLDYRMPNEGDLVWFSNFENGISPHDAYKKNSNILNIFIKYRWQYEFIIWRANMKNIDPLIDIKKSILQSKEVELSKIQTELLDKIEESKNAQILLNSLKTKKDILEIQILEKQNRNLELKNKKLEIDLDIFKPYVPIYLKFNAKNSAKYRIKNNLSYKLGSAMIANSKSIWGYIRMPYVLSYIKDMHKKEQIAYNEKIKANPNLKLPPLESYPDYKEALKEKECLTYKLGEAMIEASKNWYKGGYVKFIFKAIRLKEKYMKK